MAIICQDGQAGKICSKCSEWRAIERYRKRSISRDGYDYICFECKNAKSREWRANNKERVAQLNREYYEANHEERKAYHRMYRQQHRRYFADYMKQFWKDRPSYKRDFMRQWSRANPEKIRVRDHTRRARKLGNGGTYTVQEWRDLKAKYNYTCLRCGRQEPEIKLTLDHIVPISKGGRNSIDNFQPLCFSCNSAKHDDTVDYRPNWE